MKKLKMLAEYFTNYTETEKHLGGGWHNPFYEKAKELTQISSDAEQLEQRVKELEEELAKIIIYQLKCDVCGTASYQPNDKCLNHQSLDVKLQTEIEMHGAWRKRAEEAESQLAARDKQISELKAKNESLEYDLRRCENRAPTFAEMDNALALKDGDIAKLKAEVEKLKKENK